MGWLCHQALLVAFLGSKVLALEIPDGKPRWAVGSTPKLIPWPMARAAAQRLGFRHHDEVPLRARSTVSPHSLVLQNTCWQPLTTLSLALMFQWLEWVENNKPGITSKFNWLMPDEPNRAYEEWTSWDDWLGVPLSYEEARQAVAELDVLSQEAWWAYSREHSDELLSLRVPSRPHLYYRDEWHAPRARMIERSGRPQAAALPGQLPLPPLCSMPRHARLTASFPRCLNPAGKAMTTGSHCPRARSRCPRIGREWPRTPIREVRMLSALRCTGSLLPRRRRDCWRAKVAWHREHRQQHPFTLMVMVRRDRAARARTCGRWDWERWDRLPGAARLHHTWRWRPSSMLVRLRVHDNRHVP